MDTKTILSFDEGCEKTRYARSYMYRLTSEKRIPHYKKGKKIIFVLEELENWLLENPVKTYKQIQTEAATALATA